MAERQPGIVRRVFLKGSVLAGAAGAAGAADAAAGTTAAPPQQSSLPGGQLPTEQRARSEAGAVQTSPVAGGGEEPQVSNPGSDFMVDLLKAAGVEYVAAMPGSTFRGLHESIVNYGGNHAPQLISCVHEEISAAICHGYAKVAGKPMACLVHSNVGLQHASMAIYNAWCDKAPVIVLAGNGLDATLRRPWIEWLHTMTDLGTMVRDFVKWDDTPRSLDHYAESFMRAYEISTTPPYEPVMLVVDIALQEDPVPAPGKKRVPKLAQVSAPAGEPAAIDKAAAMLLAARAPLIVADRVARTPAGVDLLVQLAELLNAPVVDRGGRMNMPTDHFLNQTFREPRLIAESDVILGLELSDIYGLVNRIPDLPVHVSRPLITDTTRLIGISANYAFMHGNVQDMQRYFPADLSIAGDAQACLPQLIDSVRRQLQSAQKEAIVRREVPLRAAFHQMRADSAREAARSWDASPIGTGRLCMELWEQIKTLDWALVSNTGFVSQWPQRLWDINKHYQFIGGEGGYGVGYGAPAAVGAALAHKGTGRIPVAIQTDGDLLVLPGSLWTLAHHQIPLLMVMHNNRAWHQETMHIQRMANRRNRGAINAVVGTTLSDPIIDFATMARSMGVWAEGPIAKPEQLGPALARAIAIVRTGKPALLDVITQPR